MNDTTDKLSLKTLDERIKQLESGGEKVSTRDMLLALANYSGQRTLFTETLGVSADDMDRMACIDKKI